MTAFTDHTGKTYDDDLSDFLQWYLDAGEAIFTPLKQSIHFVD